MKRALAEVLWEAANVRLFPVYTDTDDEALGISSYSCAAACFADVGHRDGDDEDSEAVQFLFSCGAYTEAWSALHQDFPDLHQRQGVRYMWLLLAMHVAEDEGIEVLDALAEGAGA